jgi:hypothetical protein
MSLVKANTYQDASGGSNAVFSGVANPPGSMGFRNRLINSNMVIDQRNAGASVTPNNSYTLDRWLIENVQTGKLTVQQNAGSVTPPTGFTNYLGVTSTSAYSVLTGDTFLLTQRIEGFNVSDLAFGTASAVTVTLSFWVRSSLTGTFGGSLGNASANRSYAFSFTINAANTWEQKTVTIPGDTSGTWNTTNGRGLSVTFGLGSGSTYTGTAGSWQAANLVQPTGSVSVVGTNGATFYITGVQLEAGTNASAFEQIDYGRELAMCQRYYEKSYAVGTVPATATTTSRITSSGNAGSTTTGYIETSIQWKVNKRGTPTVTIYDMAGNSGKCTRLSTGVGTSDNQTVATAVEGETSSSVFSSGSASANCLQYHYVSSSEL